MDLSQLTVEELEAERTRMRGVLSSVEQMDIPMAMVPTDAHTYLGRMQGIAAEISRRQMVEKEAYGVAREPSQSAGTLLDRVRGWFKSTDQRETTIAGEDRRHAEAMEERDRLLGAVLHIRQEWAGELAKEQVPAKVVDEVYRSQLAELNEKLSALHGINPAINSHVNAEHVQALAHSAALRDVERHEREMTAHEDLYWSLRQDGLTPESASRVMDEMIQRSPGIKAAEMLAQYQRERESSDAEPEPQIEVKTMRQAADILNEQGLQIETEWRSVVASNAVEAGAATNYFRGRAEQWNALRAAFIAQDGEITNVVAGPLLVDEIRVQQQAIEHYRSMSIAR